jgi:hypothetical protein
MSVSALFQAIVVAVAAVAIGGSLLVVLRKALTPRAPLTAALVGVIATMVVIGVAAPSLGIKILGTPVWIVLGTFVGFVAVQPSPRETRSLLRGLALAAGCVSLYAALEPNLIAVIFGIGVSGLLLKLSASEVGGRDV